MTSGTGMRRSRSMRESVLGLFVLLAIGLLGLLVLWIRGFKGGRSYEAIVEFSNAGGMKVGTPVSYRGVQVGEVIGVRLQPRGVALKISIAPEELVIPRSVRIEANQAGLIGETAIDITPLQDLPDEVAAKPLDPNCDPTLIICNGSRLQGETKLDVNQLIRSVLKISNFLTDPEFTANINSVTKNASNALAQITKLSETATGLSQDVRAGKGTAGTSLQEFGLAAREFRLTAVQIKGLLVANRGSLIATLDNTKASSDKLRILLDNLIPVSEQAKQGELFRNLETLSANAAAASANLRDISKGLNDRSNLLVIQQTLDAARSVFQNIQKITTDVDELTGSAEFRERLQKLIKGLSNLVSSTQQLQQQTELAQQLAPIAAELDKNPAPPTETNATVLQVPALADQPAVPTEKP